MKGLLVLLICAGAGAQQHAANTNPAPVTSSSPAENLAVGILQMDRDAVAKESRLNIGIFPQQRLDCMTGKIAKTFENNELNRFAETQEKGGTVGGHCRAVLELSADVDAQHGVFDGIRSRVDMELLSTYQAILNDNPVINFRPVDDNAGNYANVARLHDLALAEDTGKTSGMPLVFPTNSGPVHATFTPGMAFDVGFTKTVLDYRRDLSAPLPSYIVPVPWTDAKLTHAEEACVRNYQPTLKIQMPFSACDNYGHDAAVDYLKSHPQKQSTAPVAPVRR